MAARVLSWRNVLKTVTTCSVDTRLHPRLLSSGQFQHLIVERRGEKNNVGLVKLNRPGAFNVLNNALVTELTLALKQLDQDRNIGCIVITGEGEAFCDGADVPEMIQKTFQSAMEEDFPANLHCIAKCRKPVIAAVNGEAMAGGCEAAMMCDIIYAADKAQLFLPEIRVATIPGAGGTQRLTRAAGKSRAMELTLTGNMISAQQAEQMGLVSKVLPAGELLEAALQTAEKIAGFSHIATTMCKEAVNASQELPLAEGLRLEKRLFQATFETNDAKEGMRAFVEKRKPNFTHT